MQLPHCTSSRRGGYGAACGLLSSTGSAQNPVTRGCERDLSAQGVGLFRLRKLALQSYRSGRAPIRPKHAGDVLKTVMTWTQAPIEGPPPSEVKQPEHRWRRIQDDCDEEIWAYGYALAWLRWHRRRAISDVDTLDVFPAPSLDGVWVTATLDDSNGGLSCTIL